MNVLSADENERLGRGGLVDWENWLLGGFLAGGVGAYRAAFCVLAAVVVITVGMLLSFGCSHQSSCAWDSAFLLDGGWRVLGGQRPHVDYYSPLGVVPQLVTALGMVVAGTRGAALGAGYALLLPLVAVAGWWVAARRVSALHALVFALMVGFTLVATHYPGHPFHDTTYAAQYNRLGGALLALLLLQVLLPPREEPSERCALLEGVCVGAILGLLMFTKITYFGMGMAAVALAGWSSFRLRAAAWGGLVGAGAAVCLLIVWYLGFDYGAFDADMKMLAGVQDPNERFGAMVNAVRWNRGALGLLVGMAALVIRPPVRAAEGDADAALSSWFIASLMAIVGIFVGLFIYSTDGIKGLPPAFAVAALVLAENFRRRASVSGPLGKETFERGFKYLLASALVAYLAGVIIVHGSLSVAYSFGWNWRNADGLPATAVVQSSTMEDVVLPPREDEERLVDRESVIARILERDPEEPELTSYQYACWTNDGLDLLRKHVNQESRIFVLDWVNPFSFALELPSPRGDGLYWHAGRVFDEKHCPEGDRVFQEVTLVMRPKRSIQPASTRMLERVYGEVLAREFERIDESALWTLFGRREEALRKGPGG